MLFGSDRLFELAAEGDEVVRLRPNAATALFLLGLVMRDECAAVAWKDMFQVFRSQKDQVTRTVSQEGDALCALVANKKRESW